jgi:hypothetical protein
MAATRDVQRIIVTDTAVGCMIFFGTTPWLFGCDFDSVATAMNRIREQRLSKRIEWPI